jgi:citrate lyase beta subunit
MKKTLDVDFLRKLDERLEFIQQPLHARYPGDTSARQPVHVLYGGAHLFQATTVRRLGDLALRSVDEYAPDPVLFAKAIGLSGSTALSVGPRELANVAVPASRSLAEGHPQDALWLAQEIYQRVRNKLVQEPVEDLRIDFEDGYGIRPDAEEDGHAASAAQQLAEAMSTGLGNLPPFIGIRIKPFGSRLRARSIQTLDIFLTELATTANHKLPRNFCITLPKVTSPEEVAALAEICFRLESDLMLLAGSLRIELMVESTQAVFNQRGEVNLLALVNAAAGRCVAVHFGPHDYSASRNLICNQPMTHFASDFAREVMQVALRGTGIRLADGPTNTLPIALHRAQKAAALSQREVEENRAGMHQAWKMHFNHITRSMESGFYQGWDLHPAQLPIRYAAVYAFFLENLNQVSKRLQNFINAASRATRVGQHFDDIAMAQGLMNYFSQAINCGAISATEAQELSGLTIPELQSGSASRVFEDRRDGIAGET